MGESPDCTVRDQFIASYVLIARDELAAGRRYRALALLDSLIPMLTRPVPREVEVRADRMVSEAMNRTRG